jgi:OOP family OmpA-OmpF porin
MKKTFIAVTAAMVGAAAFVSAPASAEQNPQGGYVGAGWGQFNLDVDNLDEAGSAITSIAKSDDNSWKIFVGYRLNPYFSLEAAYIDFGNPGNRFDATGSDGNYRVALSGFAPYAIGTLPLGPIELFAKVGYYFYDVDVKIDFDAPGPDVDSSHSADDLLYGLGAGITLGDHLHLRAEYETIELDRGNTDAFWLSAAWRF